MLKLIQLNTPKYFAASEAEEFASYLDRELEDYFVYRRDGEILGCAGINYFLELSHARLSWDMIHPQHQGQGIGGALTTHRINHIKQAQPDLSKVIVRTSQLVYPFYEKFGFTLQKTVSDFWAKGLDLYQMELALNQ